MARVELIMPKMGESIMEATILNWSKKVGDKVKLDETILEIATDKVDSEIPSPVDGKISEIFFQENDVVEIGKVIAYIETDSASEVADSPAILTLDTENEEGLEETMKDPPSHEKIIPEAKSSQEPIEFSSASMTSRFYSPLVRNIAKKESIPTQELDGIQGSGKGGRVTKTDILNYISSREIPKTPISSSSKQESTPTRPTSDSRTPVSGNVEIIEMDRMRKLISEHMVRSKQTSAHVTSFIEVDVTNIVNWRNRCKEEFLSKHNEKLTFTPIFMEAVAKAIQDFPLINISVDGDKIIRKKDINIGMAAALPSGNLIVPVIKNADYLNLTGLAKKVNDLANRARNNSLSPDEIQGGTFTVTNVGTFGNVMGTPIINQPQVAILAIGAIRKKPAVLETEYGDTIAIRNMMFLSLSYDHRVVDGFLGGSFLRKIGDYMESFNTAQTL